MARADHRIRTCATRAADPAASIPSEVWMNGPQADDGTGLLAPRRVTVPAIGIRYQRRCAVLPALPQTDPRVSAHLHRALTIRSQAGVSLTVEGSPIAIRTQISTRRETHSHV